MPSSLSLKVEDFNAGFVFANNPVVVKVSSLAFENNGLFRKVIFEVTTYYNKLESNKRTYTFEVGADGLSYTDTVRCDISSALRSALARYEYSPEDIQTYSELTYPCVSFSVKAWLRDFYNGEVEDGPSSEASGTLSDGSSTKTFYAFLGGLTDMERWSGDSDINGLPIPTSFSTKPAGEILGDGQIFAATRYDAASGEVKAFFQVNGASMDSRERATILFVNSRGVYDTISVLRADSEEYEISSDVSSLVGATAYRPSPYITTHKEGGGAVWKMSSGYVNKEWAQWFTREFLMAKHYWLQRGDRWLPIVVTPDSDSVMTYSKSDPALIAVNFAVKSAIKG